MGENNGISEKSKCSNKNRAAGGLLRTHWVSDLEKATSQLSLEKNYPFIFVSTDFRLESVESSEKLGF